MWRLLVSGIWAVAGTLLNRTQNPSTDQPSTWRGFRNFIFSTISTFGIPFVQSLTQNETVYEYVNTLLANPTTNRNDIHHQQQRRNSGVSRVSRPNFRRRLHNNNGGVRIIKPTINIIIHKT